MIVYLDASAPVKRYVAEAGAVEVASLIGEAQAIGTAVVSRAEVAAALAKAARVGLVMREAALAVLKAFHLFLAAEQTTSSNSPELFGGATRELALVGIVWVPPT